MHSSSKMIAQEPSPQPALAWGLVLGVNLLALALTWFLSPWVEPSPFPFFVAAIGLSIKFRGRLGALLAVLFASVASRYYFPPLVHSEWTSAEDISRVVMFTLVAVVIILITSGRQRAVDAAYQLAGIVESAEDSIISMMLDGTVTSWNAAAERLYGYSAKEIVGDSIFRLVPLDRREELAAILGQIRKGEHTTRETQRITKDGCVIDVALSVSPIRDRTGGIVGASVIARGVSEQKSAEQAIRQLSSAVEQTDDSVVITNRDGIIEYVNPAFERLTGYSREEALGQTPRIVKSSVHTREFHTELWKVILSGRAFRGMVVNQKKNGETYTEEKTITPIKDKEGHITHFVSTGKDVSERVQAYQSLEQLVEERTRQVERFYQQAEQRSRELEILYRADEQLLRHLRLENVLQALVDVAVDQLEADKANVQVWDEERQRLIVRAFRGYCPESIAELSAFKAGDGIAGQVFETGTPMAVEDARTAKPPSSTIAERERICSVLSVPITIDSRVFGVFGMGYSRPRTFGADDQRLFLALAQRAALAVENASLYEQAEHAATLEERHRLARELHDSVTQSLYSLTLLAEAGKRMASTGDLARVQHTTSRLSEAAQQALKEMRLMVFELMPAECRVQRNLRIEWNPA